MALSDENTTLNFVLSKNVKYKLQILADADNQKKIGSFVAQKLQEVVEKFEQQMLETFGSEEFLKVYRTIFGHESTYPPLILYDVEEEFDEDEARRNLIAEISGAPRNRGARKPLFDVNLDDLLAEADKPKEPSEEERLFGRDDEKRPHG